MRRGRRGSAWWWSPWVSLYGEGGVAGHSWSSESFGMFLMSLHSGTVVMLVYTLPKSLSEIPHETTECRNVSQFRLDSSLVTEVHF